MSYDRVEWSELVLVVGDEGARTFLSEGLLALQAAHPGRRQNLACLGTYHANMSGGATPHIDDFNDLVRELSALE